jgi:cytochrome c oxidase subunit 4
MDGERTTGRGSEDATRAHAAQGHVLSVRAYLGVFAALLALTAVTVSVSMLDLGAASIWVAMAVAVVKASLVATYFMHLRFEAPFNALVFLSSLLFLGVLFVLTMLDLGTRADVLEEQGTMALREQEAARARAAPAASSAGRPRAAP